MVAAHCDVSGFGKGVVVLLFGLLAVALFDDVGVMDGDDPVG